MIFNILIDKQWKYKNINDHMRNQNELSPMTAVFTSV